MDSTRKTARILQDVKVNVKWKISALWVAMMFIFIYVDYFGLFIPGVMEKIIEGEVAHTGIQVTQVFLLAVMTLMMIPSLMIFLSLTLPAKANRWTNIFVGILQIVVLLAGVIGESWAYYIFATFVEIVLLLLIIWYAWKWPKQEA
jgi:hypothetical protein